jgi:hypothetical protein
MPVVQVGLAWNGSDKLSGIVIKFPGVPDMYDHERIAYGTGVPPGLAQLVSLAQKFAKVADGYIVPTAACLEPVAVAHCKELCQKRGQELFPVGMQAHELCWTNAAPAPPTNAAVKSFLDKAVSEHGPKSALYISFGCVFDVLPPYTADDGNQVAAIPSCHSGARRSACADTVGHREAFPIYLRSRFKNGVPSKGAH